MSQLKRMEKSQRRNARVIAALLVVLSHTQRHFTFAWILPTSTRRSHFTTSSTSDIVNYETPVSRIEEQSSSHHVVADGALSMSMANLAERLGGLGRAKLVWDYYCIGVDPAHYFNNTCRDQSIERLLPSMRRTQRLGKAALEKLAALYKDYKVPCVEGGVATLTHVSVSKDTTTKLLLQLNDRTEVETVIIPWTGDRSTLCISSQVGCRQGDVSHN